MKSTVIDPLVFSAFAAELVKISSVEQQQVSEQPKKENLTSLVGLGGAGLAAGITGGDIAHKKMQQGFNRQTDHLDEALFSKIRGTSPVPVRNAEDYTVDLSKGFLGKYLDKHQLDPVSDAVTGSMREQLKSNAIFSKKNPFLGQEESAIYMGTTKSPEVLAHEIGHANIDKSRLGRIVQNNVTTHLGNLGGKSLVGGLSGGLSGMSDNQNVQRLGRWAPLLMAAPQLAYEGGASISGLMNLRRQGASSQQMRKAVGTLLPAWGTYAARPVISTGIAHLTQAGVRGLRGNPAIEDKSKTASTEEAPKKKESPYLSVGKLLGAGALGFGAGTGAGVLAGYGADKVYEKVTGKRIPKEFVFGVAPLLAGAAGTAYSVYKAKEQEAIQRALENRKEPGAG